MVLVQKHFAPQSRCCPVHYLSLIDGLAVYYDGKTAQEWSWHTLAETKAAQPTRAVVKGILLLQ